MAGLFSFKTASFGGHGSTQPQSLELWTGVLARSFWINVSISLLESIFGRANHVVHIADNDDQSVQVVHCIKGLSSGGM
jgi:DNA-binding IclR family transcriptional regulator